MNKKLRHTMVSLWHLFIVAMLVLGFAALAVFLYWTLEPKTVLEVKNQPVPVRPDTISPEATVIVSPTFCKYLNKPAKVERFLISKSVKIALPTYPNNLPIGCKTYDLPVVIPAYVTDDVYHLEYNTTYQVNPITEFKVRWYTQNFTVKHDPPLKAPAATIAPTTSASNVQSKAATSANIPSTTVAQTTDTKEQGIIRTGLDGVKIMRDQVLDLLNSLGRLVQ